MPAVQAGRRCRPREGPFSERVHFGRTLGTVDAVRGLHPCSSSERFAPGPANSRSADDPRESAAATGLGAGANDHLSGIRCRDNLQFPVVLSTVEAYAWEGRPTSSKGILDLLILRTIQHEPKHGWAIAKRIQHVSNDVLKVQQGSLYPALYRLEKGGWIVGRRAATESGREAKFFITDQFGAGAPATGGCGVGAAFRCDRPRCRAALR